LEETAPVWYIRTGDHVRLDGKEFEVLDKTLTPLGNEVGFCLCTKGENSAERTWRLFRWTDEVTRIYY
jgi:predicted deacetylase